MAELTVEQQRALALARARLRLQETRTQPPASTEDTNIVRDIGGSLVSGVGQAVSLPGQLYGLATGDFDTAAMRGAKGIIEKGEALKSPGLRERERQAQERIGEAEGFIPEVVQTAKEYVSDPRLLLSGALTSAPSMLGGLGAGAIAGKAARTVAARKMAEEAAKKAARKAAVSGAVATTAVQQGASVGEGAYERVMATPKDILVQSTAYKALIAKGVSPKDARQQLALSAARKAAAAATGISAATAGLGGVEKSLLGEAVERGVIRRVVGTGAKEAGQEAVEEGGGQLAQNIAVGEADVTTEPMKGVGSSATQGAFLGLGVGAPAGVFAGAPAPEVPPQVGEVPPPVSEAPPAPPAPTPGAPTLPEGVDQDDLQRRAAEYMDVGYPEGYAREMGLVDILRGIQEQRAAERNVTAATPETAVETPIEEPRRAIRPVDKAALKTARQQLDADMVVFPEDLFRQPTPEERDTAVRELAQDPANAPLDVLNAVMERNDQRTPAAEPTVEPEMAAPEMAAPEMAAPEMAAPTYTYEDLVKEADELVSSGQLSPESYQQATILAELSTDETVAGNLPSPMEARQFLYEEAGTVPPALVSPTAVEPVADLEEQVQEEDLLPEEVDIDYENHPLMVEYNSRFDTYLSEIEDAEHVSSVRARARKLIKAGVLDESVMDDINEAMADEEPGYRADTGRDALTEAIENARDEGIFDIEEEINQLAAEEQGARRTASPEPAPVAEPEVPAAEEELTYGAVEAALDDAIEKGEVDPKFADFFRKTLNAARETPPGEQPKFTPAELMDRLVAAAPAATPAPTSEPSPEPQPTEVSPAPAAEAPPPPPPPPPPTPPQGGEPTPEPEPEKSKAPKKPRTPRKTKTAEEVAKANEKAEKATAAYIAQLATEKSLEGSGLMSPIADAYAAHDVKDKRGFITNAFDKFFAGMDYSLLRMQLFRLPTRELVLEAERLSARPTITGEEAPIREAYEIEAKAGGLRATLLNAGGRLIEEQNAFLHGGGKYNPMEVKKRQSALFGMYDLARALGLNPATHSSLADALSDDSLMRAIDDKIANAKRPQDRGKAVKQRNIRKQMIETAWRYWEVLGKIPGGHAMFKRTVDYYAALTRATRNEMDGYVRSLQDVIGEENVARLTEVISDIDASFDKEPKEKIPGDIFDDLPTRAFPVVYIPWNRFGRYVLRIAPGTEGYPNGARYQFDTVGEREEYAQQVAKSLGISPDDATVFEKHSDPDRARNDNTSESAVLRNVLDIIRNTDLNISPQSVTDEQSRAEAAVKFRSELETQLTEMLLTALPEESIRKQFIRAKGVVGRSLDHGRVLAYNVQRYANQLPRLKFGYQLRRALSEANDELDGIEDAAAKEKASILLAEIESRLERGLNPPPNDALVAGFNSFGHTMLLSAPASALNNAIVTWQRAAFELGADYGPKAASTLFKLEGIMRLMGKVQDDPTGNVRRYYAPSVIKLPMIKNNPTYHKAFLELRDVYGTFGHGFVNEIVMQGRGSTIRTPTVPGFVMDNVRKIAGVINAPFGAIERITNEKIGMAAFMLEYDKQKAAGATDTEAYNAGIKKANRTVLDIIGKYGQAERPPLFQGYRSLLFLFKTFALNLAAFIERQLRVLAYEPMAAAGDILRGRKPQKRSVFTREEKKQAIKTLTALYAGNFLWSGVAGMFGFSLMTKMIAPFIFLFMDDDDREEWARENPEYVNNMPGYIVEKLIPETFGGYGDIIAYGPASALAGVNLSARIGYDNLFFKDPVAKTGNIWNDTKSWFLDNFAAGTGRADDFMEGVNYLMEGNLTQAAKRMVPAAVGAPTKAIMAFNEGVRDSRGRPIITEDEITLPMAVKMALGYQPIEVTKTYSRLYGSGEQLGAVRAERSKLLRRLNDAKTSGDYGALDEVFEDIEDFNNLNPGMMIDTETMERSERSYQSREERLYRGVDIREEDRARIEADVEAYWDPEA